ncbi:hypothetical protein TeGR_g7061 [Tetraparma gracilis]|uniref:MOSC domain-containing protein n=1 Tax=Tetraparma gracilis TaxID=2962635 RepID=A0ABQ6NBC7_9STRA|nr:hypothetical protein TeGR_g7061 [Tetraparma gracilis]
MPTSQIKNAGFFVLLASTFLPTSLYLLSPWLPSPDQNLLTSLALLSLSTYLLQDLLFPAPASGWVAPGKLPAAGSTVARITEILVYPLKSGRGISVKSCMAGVGGLQRDREFCLVREKKEGEEEGPAVLVTGRMFPKVCSIQPSFDEKERLVLELPGGERHVVEEAHFRQLDGRWYGRTGEVGKEVGLVMWRGPCEGFDCGGAAAAFVSGFLGAKVRLLRMPVASRDLMLDDKYCPAAQKGDVAKFSDYTAYSVCSEASLRWLNAALVARGKEPVGKERFRCNVWVEGEGSMKDRPFLEDAPRLYRLGAVGLRHVKDCGRCVLTTVTDGGKMDKSMEPLNTLKVLRANYYPFVAKDSEYYKGEPFFTTNASLARAGGGGEVRVGDEVKVDEWKDPGAVMQPLLGERNPHGKKFFK